MAKSEPDPQDNEEFDDVDYDRYKSLPPTPLQDRFADWLTDKLELEFPSKTAEQSFRNGVRLATAMRMIFQASPENREANAKMRQEKAAERERRAEERAEELAASASRAKSEATSETASETAKPAPRRGRPPKKAAPEPAPEAAEETAPKRRGGRRRAPAGTAAF